MGSQNPKAPGLPVAAVLWWNRGKKQRWSLICLAKMGVTDHLAKHTKANHGVTGHRTLEEGSVRKLLLLSQVYPGMDPKVTEGSLIGNKTQLSLSLSRL